MRTPEDCNHECLNLCSHVLFDPPVFKKKVLQAAKRAFHDRRGKGLRCWCIQTSEHLGCSGVVQLCKGVILPERLLGLLLVHVASGLRRNFFVFDCQFRIPFGNARSGHCDLISNRFCKLRDVDLVQDFCVMWQCCFCCCC